MKRLITTSIYCLLLGFSCPLFAIFNLNGTNIIQTGADLNLVGLAGVAGVTVSSQNGIDVYNIGNRRLIIRGDLMIDPELEMLIIGYNTGELIRVENFGQLTIGNAIMQNGYTRYSIGTAIFLEDFPDGFTNRVSFYNNSSLTWNGGTISIAAGKFGFYGDNVTVRINSTNAKLIYRRQDPQNQIRQETDDFISTGFTFINGDFTIVGTGQQLNGYSPEHATGSLAFSGGTPNVDVTIRAYEGGDQGNNDIKHWQGGRPILINSKTGSQLNCGPHIAGSGSSYGVALVYQEFSVHFSESDGSAIEGARYFIRDTDNGGRETYNREGHVVNNQQDFTYSLISDATGNTITQQLLLAANIANAGNGDAINTGNYAWDYRGKNNDNTDLFDVHAWAFGYDYSVVSDFEFKGVEEKNISFILIEDQNITSANEVDALAITGIALMHDANDDSGTITISEERTLCDVYDFIKANKLTNLEEPSISSLATQVSGGTLNIGNYQLVLAAGSTLKPCDKFEKIVSDVVSSIDDPDENIAVALTDPDGTYKLVRLIGLENANVEIVNAGTGMVLTQENNFTGELNYVVAPGVADSLTVIVDRDGYTTWAADVDLSTADVFSFIVVQSEKVGDPCTLSNQELEIYLLQKILSKNQLIQTSVNENTNPNITIDAIVQNMATRCTAEKQEEMIFLLQKILSKTQAIQEQLFHNH